MEQTGYVTDIVNGTAKIRIDRESSCGGNCVSCKGCPSEAMVIDVKSNSRLNIGDTVTLYEDASKVIKYSFIGYMLMALLLVAGGTIGFLIWHRDIFALLGAVVALVIGFLVVKICFKNVKSEFKITEVHGNSDADVSDNSINVDSEN